VRRGEFAVNDKEEINNFLYSKSFGFLGTHTTDEYPSITPLNFVWLNENIYFHGAQSGKKIKELKENQIVTFVVADELALIPSYFTDEKYACPATSFFKSIIINGKLEFINSIDEKINALTSFMQKLQPEGRYDEFDVTDKEYLKNIKGVNVLKIIPDSITAKFKFGQNKKEEEWRTIKSNLELRNLPRDQETIENMKKTCPFH
jgi:nitroimidazol reductase NimA-like FMN-containing flavoprotein (pyridoxamine 5'-phosphate oxidase superfamily)